MKLSAWSIRGHFYTAKIAEEALDLSEVAVPALIVTKLTLIGK